ncbi:MAG: 4-hydroxythreonine-4-phosphate dehydrogenase PdxA [Candidatus Sumerlaeia bacterium]|nr:4-hydroxythreonine-4-phosphate dehydrogenase PdxA [Candidatus Sumerlaeia bacterium]
MTKPILALTTGDPAGVGPELSIRAAMRDDIRETCRLVLLGDRKVLQAAANLVGYQGQFTEFEPETPPQGLEIIDPCHLARFPEPGVATAAGGRAAFAAIEAAIDGARAGTFQGVVTAPINKLALKMAGIEFPGHTEVFGERTNSPAFAMMMYSEKLAVGLVTCHQSLASVPGSLRRERIVEVGRLLADSVGKIRGKKKVRLAVLGLNPHAGEGGLFGNEEGKTIVPAIADLVSAGVNAVGPIPPDTAFTGNKLKEFDAFLCMYHDQGLIPFKMLAFDEGVNVTMGLPFPRTSVDHGTAYDIAWKGIASESSLLKAIALGARLAADKT